MLSHLVSYDLIKRKNYPELIEALKRFPYWHCLGSTWTVKTDQTSFQLATELLQHIDADDKLIVVTLTGQAAWTRSFPRNCQDWLQTEL
jgi:hypothetical protein